MNQNSIFDSSINMYDTTYDYDLYDPNMNLQNKLFCTFTKVDKIEDLIESIQSKYNVLYGKIFALHIKTNDEYVLTYNIELGNISDIPENTILVHRKKETNSLYSINALNQLIKSLNNGMLDSKFVIDWNNYRNCILLTQQGELKRLDTKIYKIISL